MSYYAVTPIYPWLYSLADPDNVYCYLAVGEESALLYDTAYGIGNLPETVKQITDKPVTVVLGHGHVDHANGAYQFESAYLHEADLPLCRDHTNEEYRRGIVERLKQKNAPLPNDFDAEAYIKAGMGNIKPLAIGRVFDLGGLHLETIAMPGHTAGSVGLLAKEPRVLLDSDAANPHIWLFLKESLPVCEYIAMLERVKALDFDTFFMGHACEALPKSEFDKYIRVAKNAALDKSIPYEVFPARKGYLYQEDGVGIVFNALGNGSV